MCGSVLDTSLLPLDLIVKILLKLPVKSIAKLIFVSKHLSMIIRSKDFIDSYITQSSTRPRLLFIYNKMQSQFLDSCSQENPSSDDHQKVNFTLHPNQLRNFSPPVRGLILRQLDTKVIVGNPSTGQFLTLPRVNTRRRGLYSYFGYDPVNDVHKVLCMTVLYGKQRRGSLVVSDEHQVFTLRPKQKWRKIACKHPHLPPPTSKGVCINGVVYYKAWIQGEATLICFDLTSEDFSTVKLPLETQLLVNYKGKIALCHQSMYEIASIHVWVLQDVEKQEWSRESHRVPSWPGLVGTQQMSFEGTLSTGQLIFAPFSSCKSRNQSYFFISYDIKEKTAKKVAIEGFRKYSSIKLYFDHVESPMFLSNVS